MMATTLNPLRGVIINMLLALILMAAAFLIKRSNITMGMRKELALLLWKIPALLSLWFLYIQAMYLLIVLLEIMGCALIFLVMIAYTGALTCIAVKYLRGIGWFDE